MSKLDAATDATERALDRYEFADSYATTDAAKCALDRLKFADSYSRMSALIELCHHVPPDVFWQRVGLEWDGCDNIHAYSSLLQILLVSRFESHGFPIYDAMTVEDRQHYTALPERVPIFRGCYARNKSGLSWSISRDVAAQFPFYARYRGPGQPLLLLATVRKANIAFVTGQRSEAEIVVLPRHRRILSCEPITATP